MPVIAFLVILALSCNSSPGSGAAASDPTAPAADTLSYPYKATYSSDVTVPSHPEYGQKVLKVWRMFENAQFDSMKQYYADTVIYEDASGFKFHGPSAALLDVARKDIEGLDSLRFDLSMWQSLHVNDRKEDWVYIWAKERRYSKNGHADTTLIHEQWKLTDGRVSYFNQYTAKIR